ncbi:hypothetical protein [uncultured Arcticibacterium sp.]|uniref:hypothetical protein n=1 Tax=uncultured Arcticibacterium sp. TaxID=2173042 RepID=UPI0030FB4B78
MADFIAQHMDGELSLKVQLNGRLTFVKKYLGKDLYICFPYENHWYVYNHDNLLEEFLGKGKLSGTSSWDEKGLYHFPKLSEELIGVLREWRL